MANNDNQGGQGNQQGEQSNRGFASMDSDRQREIASEGGRAAHASGNAHEFDSREARDAGSRSQGARSSQGGSPQGDADQSTRNQASQNPAGSSSGTRGGSSEQHAEAGRQSHRNDR